MKSSKENAYDLLVVGAGIYGSWMAYDAALRGLKVLIIDKGDIAGATSSASSKLIHGGLRYLEQFNFSLVKKSVEERQNLLKIAPHRVKPLKFAIPVYKNSRIAPWKYSLGLTIYDWFANIRNKSFKHRALNSHNFFNAYPFLQKKDFKKGFTYLDASTDDFRYTLEVIDGAVKRGAELWTYSELLEYKGKTARIKNTFESTEQTVQFKFAINATGQWTDPLLKTNICRLSKGVHIILPSIKLDSALLLLSPIDQRVFFALPWYGKTMIGTTDTDYKGDIDKVSPDQSDCDYLLKSFNHYIENKFTENDIISSFAGLRVLKNLKGHPSSVSRDWQWHEVNKSNFISLGGKLTSSREDCSLLVNHICGMMNKDAKCKTDSILFPWAPIDFQSWKEQISQKMQDLKLPEEYADLLITRQGKRAEDILAIIENDSAKAEPFIDDIPFTTAELHYVLKNEYVQTLDDLVRRRFPLTLLKKMNSSDYEKIKMLANAYLRSINKEELRILTSSD